MLLPQNDEVMEMQVLGTVIAFLIGSVFGSFLLTAAERVRKGVTLWGRSACPECQQEIASYHLVPLVSWMALGGRCASCKKPIAFRYPLIEFLSGLVFLALFIRFSFGLSADWPRLLFEACFALSLLFFAYFDYRWRLVPIELAGAATVLVFIGQVVTGGSWTAALVGLVAASGFVLIQVILSRGKLVGSGDPWAAAFIGVGLGWPLVTAGFYLAYVVGGLLLLLLWAMGLIRHGERVPLVTLLAGGAIGALFWGDRMVAWAGQALGWF